MYAEKLLPHDLEAEEAVVGSVLIDGDCFSRVAPHIKAIDFYRERNQLCFAACEALFQRDEAIDQITLARELSRSNQLETVGGMAYLSHLISVTPTSAHSEHYANVVARTATMRKLIDVASRISAMGYQDTDDVGATLRQAEDALFGIRGTDTQRGFMPLRQIYDQYLEDQATFADPIADHPGPVMTGYSLLDELLGGIQRSDLVILGARPSLGKSTLALNICVNAAKNGSSVGVFSLEMSREQLAMRILSSEAEIDSHRLRLGLLTEAQEQRITDAIGQLSDLPVYIDDTPFQSMLEMQSKSRRLSLEHGLDLLVVDYLQLIQGRTGRNDNRVQEIGEISRSLKIMARDLNIGLITCSQLSRGVEQRTNHLPVLSDLRDSGSIEQDADIVMFLHREDLHYTEDDWAQQNPGKPYPKNIVDLIVAKHRNGPIGNVQFYFRDNWVRFDSFTRVDAY
jgi:replicative DNA helicase